MSAEEYELEGKPSPPVSPGFTEIEKRHQRAGKVSSQGSNIYVETKISISSDERTTLGTTPSDGGFGFDQGRTDSKEELVLVPR